MAALVACTPYPRESQRMAEAFEQAQQVYGDGENDTLLFIPELDKTSVYYAGKKNYNKAALAALYYGYSEKEYDKQAAMEAFKKAELYGELVHDSLTVARADYQMGKLLYYDYMKEEALSFFIKSETYFGNNNNEKALTLNAEACIYLLLHKYAYADSCLSRSYYLAEIGNSDIAMQKTLNNYAVLYQIQGDYAKAIDCLKQVEAKDNQQKLLNYLNLGDVFLTLDLMDSASYYYNCVEKNISKEQIKEETISAAYAALSRFAEKQGDFLKALEYKKEDMRHIVMMKDRVAKENVYQIQQRYNYENIRNEMNGKIIVRQRIILLMGLIVLFVFCVLAVLQKRLAKSQKQEIEAKERILLYVRQYTNLLTRQGKTMQKLAIVIDHKDDKALLENLRATVFGNKDSWTALTEVFDILYPNERQEITHRYPELTDIERKHVILSYFDVSRQDEALLLNTSIHSVDKIRQSVNKKTENKEKNNTSNP